MYQETRSHVATGWQHLYSGTMSEPDHETRLLLIGQTQRAIHDRLQSAGPELDADEVRQMADAVWNFVEAA